MAGAGASPARPPSGLATRATGPGAATGLYALTAILLTWPLATSLTTAVPSDMGDPLLNSWIVAWGADHLWRFVSGDLRAFEGYWHANIFHPSPYALAYSEHLFPQSLQALPVWAVTRNPVLCYNLLFLSTFVLSGLGMYLLVRDLTGNAKAAIAAGLFYAFAPYRIGQYSHLQVLSSQWMPFALYGVRRYLRTRETGALAGATAALVLQVLSCGYYLLFFAPVFGVYVLFQGAVNRSWRDRSVAWQLAAAAIVAAAVVWPFVRPYLALRALEFPERSLAEVVAFSADVRSYLTAHESQWVWGPRLRMHAKAEGELFPGVTVAVLAALACAGEVRQRWRLAESPRDQVWRRRAAWIIAVLAAVAAAAVVVILATGGVSLRLWGVRLRATGLQDAVVRALVLGVLVLIVSPRVRRAARALLATETAWFAVVLASAAVLSLGPRVQTGGHLVAGTAPYAWLYEAVPGFDGVRVPARFGMIVALCFAVLGGLGLHRIVRRWPGAGHAAVTAAAVLALAEGGSAPIPLNAAEPPGAHEAPPADLYPGGALPEVYTALAALAPGAVILELPVGSPAWDVRAVFYSTAHWHHLVNGYSGGFPQRYVATAAALSRPAAEPGRARAALRQSGATHAVVHRAAYVNDGDRAVVQWLEAAGAVRAGEFGSDVLYQLP